MKTFGMHWLLHLCYLSVTAGVIVWGEEQLGQAGLVKAELGAVQEWSRPALERSRQVVRYQIAGNSMATPCLQNESINAAAGKAVAWVDSIGKKSQALIRRLHTGEQPGSINWNEALLGDYYRLGDTLAALYGADTARQVWIERCLFSGYRDWPQPRLAAMLAASDTADAARLCRHLHLNAELALYFILEGLRKQMPDGELWFDAMLPVIAFESCPRAGVPFEADIFMLAYSTKSDNVTIKVNGRPVPMAAGLARYKRTWNTPGIKSYLVDIEVRNPLTGEIKTWSKEFKTEVSDNAEMH